MNSKYLFAKASFLISLLLVSAELSSQASLVVNKDLNNFVVRRDGNNTCRVVPLYGSESLIDGLNNPATSDEPASVSVFNWVQKFTASGKVFKDISFADTQNGYIVTELGGVYKSTNGGNNWTSVMNLGFPYYWYGVYALSPDTVVIAGFNNQGAISSGVVRWSFNGGTTWTSDIKLYIPSGVGWLSHVHFFNANTGVVSAEFSGGFHYTTTGGKDSTQWHYIQVNSDLGWFAGNVDFNADGNIFTTGIHFARSTDYGLTWTSGPCADGTFDGGVDFMDNAAYLKGVTGGGSINPTVAGWIHRTTDGGTSWSGRLNTFAYPIRSVKYFNDSLMLAFGGNLFQDAGGVYLSTNAGANWNLEVSTGAEMFSYDYKKITNDSIDVWCVGSTGGSSGYIGKLYKARIGNRLVGINNFISETPSVFRLYQNYPNPFNPKSKIKFQISKTSYVILSVYDISGREVATLVNERLGTGTYDVSFDGSGLSGGVYFYKLTVGNFSETKKMVLVK